MAPAPTAAARRIGLLGFEGVAALDLVGVQDAFYVAARLSQAGGAGSAYETIVLAPDAAPFRCESGLRIMPDAALSDASPLDTVVVPGGAGLRESELQATMAAWLRGREGRVRRFVSVCTGAYGLAASGLLDGRRATTHWRHAGHAARSFPAVRFEPDAIFIKDGPCYSSAGMTAGIDLALALIEEDHGPALALATARQLVVYMKRSGGQLQYSEPLRFQTRAGDRFADLVAAMAGDLAADWSVEAMAARAGLGARQFARRFKEAFGAPPALYLERLRLDEARLRLAASGEGLARIAHATGFNSDDVLRRAFERRFGVTPGVYRSRFASAPAAKGHSDEAHPV